MENNWKEKIKTIIKSKETYSKDYSTLSLSDVEESILEAMNLVFEATKQECADKVLINTTDWIGKYSSVKELELYKSNEDPTTVIVDEKSILNINKPNL